MTVLYSVATGDLIQAEDSNQFKKMLEGSSGYTTTYVMVSTTGTNFIIRLGDAGGTNKLSIQDSASVEQWSVNSDGTVAGGSLSPTTLILPVSATPSQTTDGSVYWDSDDDRLTVGTGSATKVIGLSRGAGSDASATQELMYDTTNAALKVWNGSASVSMTTPLSSGAQAFVETSGYKGFFGLGIASVYPTYADGNNVGLGWTVREASNGAVASSNTTGVVGAWQIATGSTSGGTAGHVGPQVIAEQDWTLVWRGVLPTNAALASVLIGANDTAVFADGNNFIGFRVLTTGNIIGVCDSGGTETTRDSGVTPDGATEHTLRIEVRSTGTIVRFYMDDAQIGADVTTNIPLAATAIMNIVAGLVNNTTTSVIMYTYDAFGWLEV